MSKNHFELQLIKRNMNETIFRISTTTLISGVLDSCSSYLFAIMFTIVYTGCLYSPHGGFITHPIRETICSTMCLLNVMITNSFCRETKVDTHYQTLNQRMVLKEFWGGQCLGDSEKRGDVTPGEITDSLTLMIWSFGWHEQFCRHQMHRCLEAAESTFKTQRRAHAKVRLWLSTEKYFENYRNHLFRNDTLTKRLHKCLTLLSVYLNVHLNNGLSNESRSKEGPKRNQEMTTGDSSQVKQGIWNLRNGYA